MLEDEVVLINADGIISWSTKTVRGRLGDVAGQRCSVLCRSGELIGNRCLVRAALEGETIGSVVTEIEAADGDSSYIETTAYPRFARNSNKVEYVVLVRKDVTGRIWSGRTLRDLSEKLRSAECALEGKDSALNEILARVHHEKRELAARIRDNIDRAVLPVLSQLRDRLAESDQAYVDTLLLLLKDITSPFVDRLESQYGRLTPRELEISNLVRNGLSSKEIAALLNRSEGTVRQQRKQIRKKFGIAGNATNLSLFLRSIGTDRSDKVADSEDNEADRVFVRSGLRNGTRDK